MNKPKILVWDLEFLASKNWRNELKILPGYLICFCCKEVGKKEIITYSKLTHPGKDPTDDKPLVKAIGKVLQSADIHVFHYGTKVDFRFIQTKLFTYNMPILPEPPVMIDTCKLARNKLSLKSNSLASVAKYLNLPEQKMPITEEQWYKAFAGDKKTMKLVEERCASDVRLTEMVYNKLKPLMTDHPHIGFANGEIESCAVCGSPGQLIKEGIKMGKSGLSQRYRCRNCGSWSTKPIPKRDVWQRK